MNAGLDPEVTGTVVDIDAKRDAAGGTITAFVTTGADASRVRLRLSDAAADQVQRQLGQPYTSWDIESGVLSREELAQIQAAAGIDRAGVATGQGGSEGASSRRTRIAVSVLLADARACRLLLSQAREQEAALTVAAMQALAASAAGNDDPLASLRTVLAVQGCLPSEVQGGADDWAEGVRGVTGGGKSAGVAQLLAERLGGDCADAQPLVVLDAKSAPD